MIAQLIYTALLIGVLLYAWTEYRRAPAIGLLAMFVALTGLYFVWIPAHAKWLAELVGIGRGAELILYVWVVISLIIFLNLHLKLRVQTRMITVLAREFAIARAAETRRTAAGQRNFGSTTKLPQNGERLPVSSACSRSMKPNSFSDLTVSDPQS